jgi:hypothetical protein
MILKLRYTNIKYVTINYIIYHLMLNALHLYPSEAVASVTIPNYKNGPSAYRQVLGSIPYSDITLLP